MSQLLQRAPLLNSLLKSKYRNKLDAPTTGHRLPAPVKVSHHAFFAHRATYASFHQSCAGFLQLEMHWVLTMRRRKQYQGAFPVPYTWEQTTQALVNMPKKDTLCTLDALVQALHSYADTGNTDASATRRHCYKVTQALRTVHILIS